MYCSSFTFGIEMDERIQNVYHLYNILCIENEFKVHFISIVKDFKET